MKIMLERWNYVTYHSVIEWKKLHLDNCLLAGAHWRITMRPKTYLFSRKILMKQQNVVESKDSRQAAMEKEDALLDLAQELPYEIDYFQRERWNCERTTRGFKIS
jgi:hypothetical protein